MALDEDFVWHRHDGLWEGKGRQYLKAVTEGTSMLVCAEDLGTVPMCAPRVLDSMNITRLAIQVCCIDGHAAFSFLVLRPMLSRACRVLSADITMLATQCMQRTAISFLFCVALFPRYAPWLLMACAPCMCSTAWPITRHAVQVPGLITPSVLESLPQRMSHNPFEEFWDLYHTPWLCVVSPSTHDMPTVSTKPRVCSFQRIPLAQHPLLFGTISCMKVPTERGAGASTGGCGVELRIKAIQDTIHLFQKLAFATGFSLPALHGGYAWIYNDDCKFQHRPFSLLSDSFPFLSQLRMWWEADLARSERYFRQVLRHRDDPMPQTLEVWVAREILAQHMDSPSILSIIPMHVWK